MPKFPFSHLSDDGAARMVDIGAKAVTRRVAVAGASCKMNATTADALRGQAIGKGDVLQVARIAGISAAKRTDELIPLCHSVPLDDVSINFEWTSQQTLEIRATAIATGRTGVEMEALVAASLAALTIYDMCKSSDKAITISQVCLLRKSGGARGDYVRSVSAETDGKIQ